MLLYSSDISGCCFIETAMLDGETDLKYRKSPEATYQKFLDDKNYENFHAKIHCQGPNDKLYDFNGQLSIGEGLENVAPVDNNSILLRASTLRNTDWILAAVIYTGHDSKIMKNRNSTPHKKSQLDELTNRYIYLMFAIEILFCLISIIAMTILNGIQGQTRWYLSFSKHELS